MPEKLRISSLTLTGYRRRMFASMLRDAGVAEADVMVKAATGDDKANLVISPAGKDRVCGPLRWSRA